MKAAAIIMKYDYGDEHRGYSFEYYNIYLPMCNVLEEENVLLFDFYSEFKKRGKKEMNKRLKDFIISERPDFAVFCLFENEFDEEVISSLKEFTKTVVYFIDDPWRRKFVAHWRNYFHFSTTPDYYMFKRYKTEGIKNVILSPFGFNSSIYKKVDLSIKYDVTFVGGYSPYRKWILSLLRKDNLKVNVFGRGWGGNIKWVRQEEMVEIFNQSRVNLNLSNAAYFDLPFIFYSMRSPKAIKKLLLLKKKIEQIKGRHYEINGCGGFQFSYFVSGLNLAFKIDEEIAVYDDARNISDQIKLFLNDDELRSNIAGNGYQRARKDHTAQGYIKNLIDKISE